jgi:hypothetical protein
MTGQERTSTFTAGPGGVMTDEVGVVTGELTLTTTVEPDGTLRQRIQYRDADEWYTVTAAPTHLPDGSSIDAVHSDAVAAMIRGGAS